MYSREIAKLYAEIGIDGTTYEIGYNYINGILESMAPSKVLDFGCGTGRSSRFLTGMGAYVIGVDNNEAMIAEASTNRTLKCDFLISGVRMPFVDNYFDAAFAISVFMEIRAKDDMMAICKEIHRVMRLGCPLVIMTSNPRAFNATYKSFKRNAHPGIRSGDTTTCTIFSGGTQFDITDTYWTEEDYLQTLSAAGWIVEKTHYPTPSNPADWQTDEPAIPPSLVIVARKPE